MQIRCTQADHRNQQIIGFCIDSKCSDQRPYCNFCLPRHVQHINKLTSLELLNEWIYQRILCVKNVQKNIQECKLALDNLLNLLMPYFNFNIQQFLEIGLSQVDSMIKNLCLVESCEEILFKKLKQSIEQIKCIIEELQKNIKNQPNQKEQCNQLVKTSGSKLLILEQSQHLSVFKENSNQFTYELMKQNSIKQNQLCYAIAFNKDNSIVLAGRGKDIKIIEQKEGRLKQIQLLCEHQNNVFTLNFMRKSNNFVSGSSDHSIIIWQVIGHNQWSIQQKINGHSNCIYCLLLTNNDELIISGSFDKTIKFWIKQNQWLQQQTIADQTNEVYSLSLNEQQNKLISCSYDSYILVIESSQLNKQWSVTQKIKVDQYGKRLCFINDNLFTFQPRCKEQLYVYEMDTNNKQYRRTNKIAVNCGSISCDGLFPQQYLKSKCLLVNKNGKNVNLLRKKENGDFIIQQSIEFEAYNIYGQLSDDGEYLVTWDSGSEEIQIRKCKEL